MVLVLAIVAAVWLLLVLLVWALCAASAAGDRAMGYEPSRHEAPPATAPREPAPLPPADPAPTLRRIRFGA